MAILVLAALSIGVTVLLMVTRIRAIVAVPIATIVAIGIFELYVWVSSPADKFVLVAWFFGTLYSFGFSIAAAIVTHLVQRASGGIKSRRHEPGPDQ